MYPGIYARRAAARHSIPLVISPRGMLDRWSLQRGPIRKALASLAYERRNLRSACLFHATSDMEADAIRSYGLMQPIAVIPNGVEAAGTRGQDPRHCLEERYPGLRGRRWMLFMGRLDRKKGLDMLLDAWPALCRDFPTWHLIIAGPDIVGLRRTLEATAAQSESVKSSITFTGMLEGHMKRSALGNADVFVLPTRSENFGIAIAEALAFGTPVVTTTAAPWSDIVTYDCGWWVEPNSASLSGALRSAMSCSREELAERGRRGRRLIAEKFTWDSVGTHMAQVYRWILSGGAAPACVRET